MAQNIKENIKKVKKMGKELIGGQMDLLTQANGKIIKWLDLVIILGVMVELILEPGKTTSNKNYY